MEYQFHSHDVPEALTENSAGELRHPDLAGRMRTGSSPVVVDSVFARENG